MNIQVIRDPVKLLIFNDIFSKELNNKILKEAISLRKKFETSTIGRGIDKSFRSNLVCYYDVVFNGRREQSVLLNEIDTLFSKNQEFRDIIPSFGYPFTEFLSTNTHETQVSNYGRSNEKYRYHIDRMQGIGRMITFVYYFFIEPKKFTGGQIEFTNSPISNGNPIESKPYTISIMPKNNMAVVFDSTVAHMVHPTKSSNFNNGRFSVNTWIGFK